MPKQNTNTKADEIEVGSILVSLANHTHTMSIHHLLDHHSTSHFPKKSQNQHEAKANEHSPSVYASSNQHQHRSKPYVMKSNPKMRCNALQAYISYMTYTDMRKKRKQGVYATSMQECPAEHYQLRRPTSNKLIEQPLTAFLHRPFNDRLSSHTRHYSQNKHFI